MEAETTKATIGSAELSKSLNQSPDKIFLIDLMGKEEYAANHISGAVNIPVEELQAHLAEIPKDKTVVVACKRGLMKSDIALQELHNAGFTNVVKVEGGNMAWFDYVKSQAS